MARRDFGEVDVGLEADPLERLELFVRQRVVEVPRDRQGVGPQSAGIGPRRAHLWAGDDLVDAFEERTGHRTGGDFLAQRAQFRLWQHAVLPGQ